MRHVNCFPFLLVNLTILIATYLVSFQMLLTRLECEKKKLEDAVVSTKHAHPVANLAACCCFSPDLLCRRSGFDSWQDTLPIIDHTSFDLDMELLQELSQIVLVEAEELKLVRPLFPLYPFVSLVVD